jgi:hypothetical protein
MGRLNLYRNISITFIVFAAMILCAVFLMFYSQATVIVTSDAQTVNLNFVTEIKPSSTPTKLTNQDAIGGKLTAINVTAVSVFNTSSTRPAGDTGNSVGTIKVVNNYSKNQRLVKTTQFQGENGVIVRTLNEIDVPAGGSVNVGVYPKEGIDFKPIESGKLTIIKLNTQLQDKIYGETIEPLNYMVAGGDVYYIAESDINRAKKDIIAKAVDDYLVKTSSTNANVKGDLVSYSIDKKLGDATKTFTMTASVQLKIIEANEEQLAELIKSKIQKMDLKGLSADNIDTSKAQYVVLDIKGPDSIIIKVSYPLKAFLTEDNEIMSKSNFTDKTKQEIRTWSAQTGVIKNVETVISPYWRDVTPKDPKRIKIIIQ